MPDPISVLRQESEPVPQWLFESPELSPSTLGMLLESRVGFYPGAGDDGHMIQIFGGAGAVHCFVHADFDMTTYGQDPLGYQPILKQDVSWDDLIAQLGFDDGHPFPDRATRGFLKGRWDDEGHTGSGFSPSAVWTVFKGPEGTGPERIASLYLFQEAVWVYWNLWFRRGIAPYAILLQDHGFGGNWARFGDAREPLFRMAEHSGALPRWLFVGESTDPWPGYDGPTSDPHRRRSLYKLR